jgi:periplasmic divalent cation tolerance protein
VSTEQGQTDLYIVYIRARDRDEAVNIARVLLDRRLAACANIVDNARSLYWWEGEIQESDEAIVIAKTQQSRLEALSAAVKRIHGYSYPCIVAIPITAGNREFPDWIGAETAPDGI